MAFFDKIFHHNYSWQYDAHGTVWKLMCEHNTLVGDARDTERKHATFFALDIRTGAKLWNNAATGEKWWISMQEIVNDVILLHGFEKPDLPIPKGMYALDISSGVLLWKDDSATFLFSYNGKAYVQRADFREKHFYAINPRTGAVAQDYGGDEEALRRLRALAADEERWDGYVFPQQLTRMAEAAREAVMKHVSGARLRGGIDAAEINGMAVASWHEPARGAEAAPNNLVTNTLVVIDVSSGKRLYEDVLVASAPAPSPDTFFVKNGVLMYVTEGTRITGVRLADLRR